MATELLVPTWYAVKTPPDALFESRLLAGDRRIRGAHSPSSDLDEAAIQPGGVRVSADLLKPLDNI